MSTRHREPLGVDEIRDLDNGDYIVAKLHDDEYWMQGEGRVLRTIRRDNGSTEVVFRGGKGHENRLTVPADGRERLRLDGAAAGAERLHVTEVYLR